MNPAEKGFFFTRRRQILRAGLLSVVMAAGFASADTYSRIDSETDQNWTNASSWHCKTDPNKTGVPQEADEARIGSATVQITTAVTVGYFRNGVDGFGEVVIDGGSLLAAGENKDLYNSAGYNYPGTLIIINGGSATFSTYFIVGYSNVTGCAVLINDGSLRVAGVYYHNKNYEDSPTMDTRTTINTGGLLEAGRLQLNAGVMNIAGGTVIIKTGGTERIRRWINEGRIIAMGGKEGWEIKITVDPDTGYTVLVAEEPPVSTANGAVAGNAKAEETVAGNVAKTIILGLTGGILLLMVTGLMAFYLYRRKQSVEKCKLAAEKGSTRQF